MSRPKRLSASLFFLLALILAATVVQPTHAQTSATAYEGARLITGDGAVVENSAFVVENGHFTQVGRRVGE